MRKRTCCVERTEDVIHLSPAGVPALAVCSQHDSGLNLCLRDCKLTGTERWKCHDVCKPPNIFCLMFDAWFWLIERVVKRIAAPGQRCTVWARKNETVSTGYGVARLTTV